MYSQANVYRLPIKSSSVDLVVADPPFGIGFTGKPQTYNRNPALVEHYLEIGSQDYSQFAISSLCEIRRILKPTGTAWIIMGWNNLRYWDYWGNVYFKHQIGHVIWKYQFGVYTKKRPVTSHYHLLVFVCGDKWTWNQQGYDEDVWTIKRLYKHRMSKYPTHIPDQVIRNIVTRSSNAGDVVYDPFVGSGTTVKVSNQLDRVGLGSDLQNNQKFWYLTNSESVV